MLQMYSKMGYKAFIFVDKDLIEKLDAPTIVFLFQFDSFVIDPNQEEHSQETCIQFQ